MLLELETVARRVRRCAVVAVVLVIAVCARSAGAAVELGITTSPPLDSTQLQQYTAVAGVPPRIEMWFTNFGSSLLWSGSVAKVEAIGATPMVTWDPMDGSSVIPFADIAAGKYDSYLQAQAVAARQAQVPIYVRFAHEMNLTTAASPWGPGPDNTPADFVAAWRHVVTIFRQQGATNVKWVWAPNTDCDGLCPFTAYYPGDSWVDDVGLDGYNFAATHGILWMSLDQIFGSSYATLTSLSTKPVMFTETASTELGGNKAAWITRGFLDDIPTLFPRVVAVIWWQRTDVTNWTVGSSDPAAAAWRAVASSPYYGGTSTSAAEGGVSSTTSATGVDSSTTAVGGGGTSTPAAGDGPSTTTLGPSSTRPLHVSMPSPTKGRQKVSPVRVAKKPARCSRSRSRARMRQNTRAVARCAASGKAKSRRKRIKARRPSIHTQVHRRSSSGS
jgi:mannan endo-1,4-beta-mannosidase